MRSRWIKSSGFYLRPYEPQDFHPQLKASRGPDVRCRAGATLNVISSLKPLVQVKALWLIKPLSPSTCGILCALLTVRNGQPEIQYLTSVVGGEQRGGVERKHGEGSWLTIRNRKTHTYYSSEFQPHSCQERVQRSSIWEKKRNFYYFFKKNIHPHVCAEEENKHRKKYKLL